MSTAKFFTMPNETLTCSSPMRTKWRIVSKSCVGSFIAPPNFGSDWLLNFISHSFRKKVLLTILRPPPCLGGICAVEIDWIWSRFDLVPCILVLQRVPPWRMYSGRSIPLETVLKRVAQHASQLIFSFVVPRMWYQLWVCLTSESLLGSESFSLSSNGVYRTRHQTARHYHLVLKRRRFCCLPSLDCFAVW